MLVVVASSIDMAHKLKIKSVAEGIESEDDWRLLRKMDCDIGQGFLIAKPMPSEDFFKFVSDFKIKPISTSPTIVQEQNKAKFKANEEYKILVVDDDSFVRRIIVEILNSLGFQNAKTVSNAESAIQLFNTDKYDIIITDIFMPDITGLDFIKRIRTGKTLAAADIRIIVLSNLTQSDVLGAALALDVNGLIVKPITPDIIERKIRHALSEPTHLHPKIAYEAVNIDFTLDNEDKPKQTSQPNDLNTSITETIYVPIHALTTGMILKKAVYYKNGELLLNAGETLTDDIIKRFFEESKKIESIDFLIEKTETVTT
jgi:CheY-like chemotaxis protein